MQLFKSKKSLGIISLAIIVLAIIIALLQYLEMKRDAKIHGPVADTVIFKKVAKENVLKELQAGNIDYYLSSLDSTQALAAKNDKNIKLYSAYSEFGSIAFNPAPGKGGKLNPFSIQKVRLAMNYLVDKQEIVDTAYGGLAIPVAANIIPEHPSYQNIKPIVDKYDFKVDKTKAEALIAEGMKSAGAVKTDDKWTYKNKPVELIVYIDNETKDSKEMAEIISTELEGVGFTVNKNYYNRSDESFKSPTYTTDPNELKWNFYITGWIYYGASKYTSFGFPGIYEPKGGWKYENQEIKDIEEQMKNCETEAKWAELNRKLTDLHLNDSVGIWLVAKEGLSPAKSTVKGLVNDEYIGLRFLGNIRQAKNKNSNTLTIGSEYLYEVGSSWNPVVIESIGMIDIVNAIHDPARWNDKDLETKPFRWGYTIKSTGNTDMPADAFTWNVNKNKWDNVAKGTKAKTEITLDLSKYLGTKWHDGEEINWGDVLYFIASTWDRSYDKTKQKISDEGWQDYFEGLQGLRISGDNLIVYLDRTDFDKDNLMIFPKLFQRSAPLEIYAGSDKLVFGNKGFQYGEIENDKLQKLNLTNKDHIAKIFTELDSLNYSEIAPFVSVNGTSYFSEENLASRKKALTDWYQTHGHLIISDGPFYIDNYNSETGDITLKAFRSEAYPFTKGIWCVK